MKKEEKNVIPVDELNVEQTKLGLAKEPQLDRAGLLAEQSGIAETAQSDLDSVKQRRTESESATNKLLNDINTQSDFTAQAEKDAGLSDLESQLSDINARIKGKSKVDAASMINERNRFRGTGVTEGTLGSFLNTRSEKNAIESLLLGAEGDRALGRLQSANSKISRSVEAKFEPLKAQLGIQKFNLGRIDKLVQESSLTLDKSQKKKFSLQMGIISKQEKEIDDISDIALRANEAGAGSAEITAITNAKTKNEAIKAARSLGRAAKLENAIRNATLRKKNFDYNSAKNAKIDLQKRIDSGEIVLDKAQRDTAFKLADDWEAESKDTKQTIVGYNKFVGAANRALEEDSPASHLAVVFNYMKTLDPTSVVRESEFKSAADASRWLQQAGKDGIKVPLPIAKAIRKVNTGELLSDVQIKDFGDTVQTFYDSAIAQQEITDEQFSARATQFGVPANAVVRELRSPLQLAKTPNEKEVVKQQITSDYSNTILDTINNASLYGELKFD